MDRAIFAGGCFWCTEAIFMDIEGVVEVCPGYIGGDIENPTYEMICTGKTGHVEAIEIIYDSKKVAYVKLLEIFFDTHDPTQVDGQGNDIGSQYLSVIYFTNNYQKEEVIKYIERIVNNYHSQIVTKLYSEKPFYKAEDYHENYFNNNRSQLYCQIVIEPKYKKFINKYNSLLKNNNTIN
jgi:peptide-methionine (S)-S-oxide reductase